MYIESKRLIIRDFNENDVNALYRIKTDDQVLKFAPDFLKVELDLSNTINHINHFQQLENDGDIEAWCCYAIEHKQTHEVMGCLCFCKSMRQTIKEIEVNIAYRWFLGLDFMDKVPHFTTFGKNCTRRFKDTDLFEQIFSRILEECFRNGCVKPKEVFVDATHAKACANSKKYTTEMVREEALFYEKQLQEEIAFDRE
jgi:hypothetical protein